MPISSVLCNCVMTRIWLVISFKQTKNKPGFEDPYHCGFVALKICRLPEAHKPGYGFPSNIQGKESSIFDSFILHMLTT